MRVFYMYVWAQQTTIKGRKSENTPTTSIRAPLRIPLVDPAPHAHARARARAPLGPLARGPLRQLVCLRLVGACGVRGDVGGGRREVGVGGERADRREDDVALRAVAHERADADEEVGALRVVVSVRVRVSGAHGGEGTYGERVDREDPAV